MKKLILFFVILPLFWSCQSKKEPKLEITTISFNQKNLTEVLKLNTLTDVVHYFGVTNCIIDTFPKKGWCKNYQDVYVFKNQKDEIHIRFVNDLMNEIRIGEKDHEWIIPDDLMITMTLDSLNLLNGKEFIFNNFTTDNGGKIISWNNGKLSSTQAAVFLTSANQNFNTLSELGDTLYSQDERLKSSHIVIKYLSYKKKQDL